MTTVARREGLVKRATVEIPQVLYNKLLKHSRKNNVSVNKLLSERVHPWLEDLTLEED